MARFHPNLLYHIRYSSLLKTISRTVMFVSRQLEVTTNFLESEMRTMLSVYSVSCQQLTPYNCFYLESNYPESREIYKGSYFPVHAQYIPLLNNDPYGSVQSTLTLSALAFHRGSPCLLQSPSI
jgi:hypothetical protein